MSAPSTPDTPAEPTALDGVSARQIAVDANRERLAACPGPHTLKLTEQAVGFAVWVCVSCGGRLTEVERRAYVQGFKHGRRSV